MTVHGSNSRRLRRGAALLALTLPLAGCGLSFQTLPKFSGGIGPHYTVKATFQEVLNLPVNAQVRVGPQVVGTVATIGTSDFVAHLDLDIKNAIKLPVGTTAQVRFDNPLGDQYILLIEPQQPAGRFLGPGQPLAVADTGSAPSVEDAFGALSAVLNGGGINQLQTIVHELNQTFDGNQQQIHDLLGQINTAVSSLADGRNAVNGALDAINNLSTQLNAGSSTITAGIDAVAPAIGVLASQNGEISNLLANFASLSDVANRLVAESGTNSVRGAQALVPVLDQLVAVKQQLGKDLQDVATLSQQVKNKTPGDYLQFGLTLNIVLPPGPATAQPPAAVQTAGPPDNAVRRLMAGGLR